MDTHMFKKARKHYENDTNQLQNTAIEKTGKDRKKRQEKEA